MQRQEEMASSAQKRRAESVFKYFGFVELRSNNVGRVAVDDATFCDRSYHTKSMLDIAPW